MARRVFKRTTKRRATKRRRLQPITRYRARGGALATTAAALRVGGEGYKIAKQVYRDHQERKSKRQKTSASTGNVQYGGGNDFSRARGRFGRYPRLKPSRLLKLINVGMSSRIERFQGITNFDTNTGFFTIANREESDTGFITMPLHVYNLTVFKNNNLSPTPVLGQAIGWDGNTGAAGIIRKQLLGQNPTGLLTTAEWTSEKLGGPELAGTALPNSAKIHHEWTQVNLNLYGARVRPTWFKISFMQVRNEFANFSSAAPDNERFRELINSLTGNMIYSNLQTRDMSAMKFVKVLKSYKYMIPADTNVDLNTACGKIKEVKLFYKHGRVLNMMAHENKLDSERLGHKQEDGIDYETYQEPLNTCADPAQVFMVIQAWSPSRASATTAQWALAGTNYTPLASDVWTAKSTPTSDPRLDVPSYDMILRQKYSVPS